MTVTCTTAKYGDNERRQMDKEKSITQILDDVKSEICDKYCKYPYEVEDEADLDKICENCPLERL